MPAASSELWVGTTLTGYPAFTPALVPDHFQARGTHEWLRKMLARYSINNQLLNSRWSDMIAAASAEGELRVAVLGTSVTNGCGSCDFKTLKSDTSFFGDQRNETCKSMCVVDYSWARIMHDELALALPRRVRTVVIAKNAVGPAHFCTCTRSKVAENTHIVLVDVATNLFSGSVGDMIDRVHWAAPRAVIIFVDWQHQLHTDNAIVDAAKSTSTPADVLRVTAILQAWTAPHPLRRLYALSGRDQVHPNPLGHRLLGSLVAAFVVKQLADSHPSSLSVRARAASTDGNSPGPQFEKCYDHATELPVSNRTPSRSWQLVDDATGSGKGIVKLGLVSNVHGDKLTLGPFMGPPKASCSLLRVSIGYLLKRDDRQGNLHFGCTGCHCGRDQEFMWRQTPFPEVSTDAHLAVDPSMRRNMTVTTTLPFVALWHRDTPCYITVTHMPHPGKPHSPTRVRVDSLHIEHKGVASYAGKVLGHPKRYPLGIKFSMLAVDPERGGCLSDCDRHAEGGWVCKLRAPASRPALNTTRLNATRLNDTQLHASDT